MGCTTWQTIKQVAMLTHSGLKFAFSVDPKKYMEAQLSRFYAHECYAQFYHYHSFYFRHHDTAPQFTTHYTENILYSDYLANSVTANFTHQQPSQLFPQSNSTYTPIQC
jgi:hypothetical protein